MGYKEIGRRIQKAREEAGLSQEQLAQMINCSQPALSNYELGKRRLYLSQLQAISRALGKPLSYFLEDEQPDALTPSCDEDASLAELACHARDLGPQERQQLLEFARFLRWRASRAQTSDGAGQREG